MPSAWTSLNKKGKNDYPVYGIILNLTVKDDVLLRATSSMATDITFEQYIENNKNKTIQSITIPSEQITSLTDNTIYLLLHDVGKTMKIGDLIPITLKFRYNKSVQIMVEVKRW